MVTLRGLPSWEMAIAESGLPPETRLVAYTLRLYHTAWDEFARPLNREIARYTGLDEDTVDREIATLLAVGYVHVTRRDEHGRDWFGFGLPELERDAS